MLVTSKDADRAKDSFKCRSALKYKIPVVSVDFLNECVKEGRWVDPEPFYVLGETRSQLLHRGLISSSSKFSFHHRHHLCHNHLFTFRQCCPLNCMQVNFAGLRYYMTLKQGRMRFGFQNCTHKQYAVTWLQCIMLYTCRL